MTTYEIPADRYALIESMDGGSIFALRKRAREVVLAIDNIIAQIKDDG